MMKRRRAVAAAAAAVLALSVAPLVATPAGAISAPVPVATGLDTPYKLTFGPDGHLYVAEAGTAGDEECLERTNPESGEVVETCYGATGGVTRIDLETGEQEQVVTDLPSIGQDGEAIGPADVAFSPSGVMHVIIGLGGDLEYRDHFSDPRIGTVITVDDEGDTEVLADLVQFEHDNDPDQVYDEGQPEGAPPLSEGVDSNPFGLTFDGVDVLAVDAGGNTVLRITPAGVITVEHVLPPGMAEAPPFIGLPPGTMIPYQPVPTAVDLDAEGTPLVSELTGFPFPVGGADVYDVSGDEPESVISGLTNILDIDVDVETGNVYVLEFADNGLLSGAPAPALVEVRPDGSMKYLLYGDQLPPPGGVEVGPDGMIYLTACTLCGPGTGMVWQLDPSVPSDPATADACDPLVVPGAGFPDTKGSVHREAIDCLAFWGAVEGFVDGSFGPQQAIRRDQVASMVARALAAAGVELPASPPDAFADDEGSVHEPSIDALAEMGVVEGYPDGTYRGSARVTRAQIASMAARAWDAVTGEALPAGDDAFTDDDDSVHEANIDAVAAAGWVNGVGDGLFAPQNPAVRAQFASILARMLSSLVEGGHATVPVPEA
jgi:hypothetical protein